MIFPFNHRVYLVTLVHQVADINKTVPSKTVYEINKCNPRWCLTLKPSQKTLLNGGSVNLNFHEIMLKHFKTMIWMDFAWCMSDRSNLFNSSRPLFLGIPRQFRGLTEAVASSACAARHISLRLIMFNPLNLEINDILPSW